MTTLFIKRPVLAIILNCFVLLLGILGYRTLNLSEYPEISVPKVKVAVVYPGSSMKVMETDITFYLEDYLSGISGVDTVVSTIGPGFSETYVTFKQGTKLDTAMADIRERTSWAKRIWPKEVQEPYIEQQGKEERPVLWLSLTSEIRSPAALMHFAKLYIENKIKSIAGVSMVKVFGVPYIMRVELDRMKMAGHDVSPQSVIDALAKNQVSLTAGKFHGGIPITFKLELEDPNDFENIIVKKSEDSIVFLRDVAKVSLSEDETILNQANKKDAVLIGPVKSSDGNPLHISNEIRALLPTLKASLPKDIKLSIEYDVASFIQSSLRSLGFTILEACALVLLVVFFFLRNLRSTLIPLVAVPISLIGALAFVKICGFSLNTFSILALVLAVGLVVDDAIIVLENIHRHLETGLSPVEAAIKGSREIAFSIVAMTLTLVAVFMPVALTGGLIGQVLIEFGITLAAAVLVSGFVALTLSPLMCSRLLKASHTPVGPVRRDFSVRGRGWILGGTLILFALTALLYWQIPKRLMPLEDRGFIWASIEQLPGGNLTTLLPYIHQVESIVQKQPSIKTQFFYSNPSWGTGISWSLKDYSQRKESAFQISDKFREQFSKIPSVTIHTGVWDTALPGLEENEAGSDISVAIQTTESYESLVDTLAHLESVLRKDPILKDISRTLHLDFPGYRVKVDEQKMALLEVDNKTAASAMQTLFDRNPALDFFKDSLRYKVILQGVEQADNLHEVEILNAKQERIPLSAFMELIPTSEPKDLTHYNRMRSGSILAQLGQGQDLSSAVSYLETRLKAELPPGYTYNFTGAAKNLKDSSNTFLLLLLLAMLFIYGILAIQFESFLDPLIILVTVPLASFAALFFIWVTGNELNLFGQIGLITLIGLISKHGILLVDFANKTGSMQEALAMRLRPILMTTGAMVVGAIPLLLASGAGSEARQAIGLVLVSGLSFGTLLTLWVIPAFYGYLKKRPQEL